MIDKNNEVLFGEYCKTCKYERYSETDSPCAECLAEPVNLYSHKPVKWEGADGIYAGPPPRPDHAYQRAVKYVPENRKDREKAIARQNIDAEYTGNKVQTIDDKVTDDQYPSATAVKKALGRANEVTAQSLAKKIDAPDTCECGDVLTVEEIDENGKPTKWKTAPAATEQKQADWGQNDETAADFVKNRPGGYVVEQEQSITLEAFDQMVIDGVVEAKSNDIITLNIDGVSNSYEVKSFGGSGALYIGDSPEEEPTMGFTMIFGFGKISIVNADISTEAKHTYKFKCKVPKKFAREYIPDEAFEIRYDNSMFSPENRLNDEEMSQLKTLHLFTRKQSFGYPVDIAVSPSGQLYLIKTFIEKKILPTIEFNSNLASQDILVSKNDFKSGDFIALEMCDKATQHRTCIVFPPFDIGGTTSYITTDMQTVAFINNKLFAITVIGACVSGSIKNTTINIKKIL